MASMRFAWRHVHYADITILQFKNVNFVLLYTEMKKTGAKKCTVFSLKNAKVVLQCYHMAIDTVNNNQHINLIQRSNMPKIIHTMIRVLQPERSKKFYAEAFKLEVSHQFDFPDFTLIYLRNPENDFEIELTHNHERSEPYTHGDGYGHCAFVTDDLAKMHGELIELAYAPTAIKEFKQDGLLLARFFFVTDPDGYKIEVIEKGGHFH